MTALADQGGVWHEDNTENTCVSSNRCKVSGSLWTAGFSAWAPLSRGLPGVHCGQGATPLASDMPGNPGPQTRTTRNVCGLCQRPQCESHSSTARSGTMTKLSSRCIRHSRRQGWTKGPVCPQLRHAGGHCLLTWRSKVAGALMWADGTASEVFRDPVHPRCHSRLRCSPWPKAHSGPWGPRKEEKSGASRGVESRAGHRSAGPGKSLDGFNSGRAEGRNGALGDRFQKKKKSD